MDPLLSLPNETLNAGNNFNSINNVNSNNGIGTQIFNHDILLPPLLRLHIEPAPHRELAQGHDDQAGGVGTRTARHARHALAAIPYRVALQQLLQVSLALAGHDVHDVLRIVSVELGSRTDSRTHAAVHAGLHALFYPVILI